MGSLERVHRRMIVAIGTIERFQEDRIALAVGSGLRESPRGFCIIGMHGILNKCRTIKLHHDP